MEPLQFLAIMLDSAVRAGTPLLFAAVGEVFAERAGVLNLGVEGMMLLGAMAGFWAGLATGNPWVGLLAAAAVGVLLALLHALVSVTLRSDQVVSGLALTIFGAGLSAFFGAPLVGQRGPVLPHVAIPWLSRLPVVGPLFDQNVIVYLGYGLFPLAWLFIYQTRPGLSLRAVGEHPATADAMGVDVYGLRYLYTAVGGALAGVAGANLSLAYAPGWVEGMTAGLGWIAVGLVIFAQWSPLRAALGSYLFGGISRLPLDLQTILQVNISPYWTGMLPYLFTIAVLILSAREALRRRLGAPAALGVPYVRGERGI